MKRRMSFPKVQLTRFHFQKQSFDRFSLRDAKGTILLLSERIKGSPHELHNEMYIPSEVALERALLHS